jgi:glucose-1-phosphate thymidylyltransferase
MAGMGKRMRPHTLTTPKPLLPVAGKAIVQRLAEDLAKTSKEKVDEIVFIVGPSFGKEVENTLVSIAEKLGTKGTIAYQEEPRGTAHAVLCAGDALKGKIIVAFADTLFKTDFKIDDSQEGVIWVKKIEDPRSFGVVTIDEKNIITGFVEKPETFISDLAIIGIYYFRDGAYLRKEMQYLIDNNIIEKGEFQLTNALDNMRKKGTKFVPGTVTEWLDCGNKDAMVYTNRKILELDPSASIVHPSASVKDSVITPPCFIGEKAIITGSKIGPFVSAGSGTIIKNSTVKNTILRNQAKVEDASIENAMIGSHALFRGKSSDLSLGDYSEVK